MECAPYAGSGAVVIPANLMFDVEISRKSDAVQQPFTVTVLPEVGGVPFFFLYVGLIP